MDPRAIAIVGMACRYPDAADPLALWRNILAARTSFRPLDSLRWAQDAFERGGRDPLTMRCRRVAWIDDVDRFAGTHFGIAPRRAEAMDPQQRIILEVAREALCDAGLETRPFARRRTAVMVGAGVSEYAGLMVVPARARQLAAGDLGDPAQMDGAARHVLPPRAYTMSGSLLSMCATAVAQAFDLGGPALAIDTACASSLTAVVQGVHYLRGLPRRGAGEAAPVVLAGGVYLNLLPDNGVGFSRLGAMAVDGCRPFDAGADGFLLGEGAGLVVLKRLEDAVADGDRVYAVVRGVAWNCDGAADSPTVPLQAGQVEVLRAGFEDADVDPGSVVYVECHGTGTPVGDPVELAALAEVLPEGPRRPRLGAIKGNIGHTLTAAGVAGLMRAALALHHRTLPPQASWERWHPTLEPYAARFAIETAPASWDESPRRASVSAFGFGGTNAFAVLEEAPPVGDSAAGPEPLAFGVTAPTPALLDAYLAALRPVLAGMDRSALGAAAWTLTACRAPSTDAAIFTVREGEDAGVFLSDASLRGRLSDLDASDPVVAGLRGDATAWDRLYPPWTRRLSDLPMMPLERQRYWIVEPAPLLPR